MPVDANTVEYNANSRTSEVNIVSYENGTHTDSNEQTRNQNSNIAKGKQPIKFERASTRWWDLRMDSKILEDQFKISSLPQVRHMFRCSLCFVIIQCIAWLIYFPSASITNWTSGAIYAATLLALSLVLLLVSFRKNLYCRLSVHTSLAFLVVVALSGLLSAYFAKIISPVGSLFIAIEVIVLIYLTSPVPAPFTFAAAATFSIVFEVLHHVQPPPNINLTNSVISHILLHIAVHIIGVHVLVNLQILRHSTFRKVCQVVRSQQAKSKDEKFGDLVIKSVMPKSIADKLMERNAKENADGNGIFRPFIMEKMENVSILYADIVGFTQMSANKTAAKLVSLLNNLFGRFDKLCEVTGCEKISTLGDCYYCVAGCPESRPDHAVCCVEMGLGMVAEIKKFCKENNINVNMRVGIHTGYVLCGIVGTKRFKFDVWSNDVSLANGMEQHGIPGRIHISKATLDCLGGKYDVEDSKLEERDAAFQEKTGKTYLIVDNKGNDSDSDASTDQNGTERNNLPSSVATENNVSSQPEKNNVGAAQRKPSRKSTKRKNDQQILKREETNGHRDSLEKQDQLMQYLGQHISPFSGPRPLKRLKRVEDSNFIETIKDDPLMSDFYRHETVGRFGLLFNDAQVEREFRGLCESETSDDKPIAVFMSTRYRLFVDMVVTTLVTLLLFVSSILLLESTTETFAWIIVFVVLFLLLLLLSFLCGLYVYHESPLSEGAHSCAISLSTWTRRHVLGAMFLLIPAAVVLSHMFNRADDRLCSNYVLLLSVLVIQFLNFNQLMSWMRTCLAAVVTAATLALVFTTVCPSNQDRLRNEYILDALAMLCFVWFVNRHFELNCRLDFYGDHEMKFSDLQMKKEQAKVDALLENFIPPHVSKALQDKPLYSKTHKKVGVIFGTIVNFNELYEEEYESGMQFLRYLSELISDVDDLLKQDKYKDIEKIKTIGTTFMLASGLNPNADQESTGPESHLCRLMGFCVEMQNAIDSFNKDMLNFQLVLRVGFNHGEVTAGVIGTTKRLYDIWGDTVNTASRMDSTGVPGRIQVSEESMNALKDHYNFSFCGEKFIKGKGQMRTYLLVRDDEHSRQIIPNPGRDYEPF